MPERVSIRAFLSLAVGIALVGLCGCRKRPPPPLVPENLGTADRPLLPLAKLAGDPDILSGRAAPIRAADISEEELARADEPQDAPDQGSELSTEDADLIEELVGLIATAAAAENYDELGDYLVEEQREAALTLIRAGKKLDTALADFQDALPDDAGDSRAQVGGLLTDAGGGTGLFAVLAAMTAGPLDDSDDQPLSKVTLVGMKMANSDTAAGSLSANQVTLPVEFALIDDDWYLQLPDTLVEPETVDAVNDLADLLETKINDLTDRLDDGSLATADLQGEIASASTEVKSAATELAPLVKRLEALAQVRDESGEVLPAGGEVSEENKKLITELVDLFGEAVTERRFGDLMEFFVPDQQEQAETIYPAFGRLLVASDALAQALEDDDADTAQQVRAMAATLAPYLSTEGLGMTGDNQAVAFRTVGDRRTRLQYEYIDDDWYYRDPVVPADADQADALAGRVTNAADKIDALTGEVDDGSITAAEVPARIVAILSELRAGADNESGDDAQDQDEGDGDPDGDDEGDDDGGDDDDEDAEDDNSNDNTDDDQADKEDDQQAAPAAPPTRPGAGRGRRLGN